MQNDLGLGAEEFLELVFCDSALGVALRTALYSPWIVRGGPADHFVHRWMQQYDVTFWYFLILSDAFGKWQCVAPIFSRCCEVFLMRMAMTKWVYWIWKHQWPQTQQLQVNLRWSKLRVAEAVLCGGKVEQKSNVPVVAFNNISIYFNRFQ